MGNFFKPSVRNKLLLPFALILLIPCLVIGLISYQTAKNAVSDQIGRSSAESVQLLNSTIDRFIQPYMQDINYLADKYDAVVPTDEWNQIRPQLIEFAKNNPDMSVIDFGNVNGDYLNSYTTKMPDGYDPRVRPWYQDAMKDKTKVAVTSPYVSKTTGDFVVGIAKVAKDGQGVLHCEVKVDTLAKIVKNVQIGNDGYALIMDSNGKSVVHPTFKPGDDLSKNDWAQKMLASKSGTFSYVLNGKAMQITYQTNANTGWKISGTMLASEVVNQTAPIFKTTLIVIAIAFIVGALAVFAVIRTITRPLKALVAASDRISEGDLTERVPVKSKDEFGQLSISFNQMTESLQTVIREVAQTADQLAASSEELTASAEQTSKATETVAEITQDAAAGSEMQVTSIRESSKAITELADGVQQIANHAQLVASTAAHASEVADDGNGSIQVVVQQMNSISDTVNQLAAVVKGLGVRSKEIGQIVEAITGISSQTNLLALNAAIEAARAGEHGRGFAVVADEVRKLAEQSSNSAGQIANLIQAIQVETEQAVRSMEAGTTEVASGIQAVEKAGSSFEEIQKSVSAVTSQIQEVSAASHQMSAGTVQVVQAMETISEVAETSAEGNQNVSAAAQQQLASMEEITSSASALSTMAEELQKLVDRFKV